MVPLEVDPRKNSLWPDGNVIVCGIWYFAAGAVVIVGVHAA